MYRHNKDNFIHLPETSWLGFKKETFFHLHLHFFIRAKSCEPLKKTFMLKGYLTGPIW